MFIVIIVLIHISVIDFSLRRLLLFRAFICCVFIDKNLLQHFTLSILYVLRI